MNQAEAIKEVLKEAVTLAAELGREERVRLGRELTKVEETQLAALVERQLRLALAMAR